MAPSQLNFFASGRPQSSDYHDIVPRTPHSRSGHAEEAVTQADLDDEDAAAFATYRQQQSEPLLVSSASPTFPSSGYRSRGDDHDNTRSRSTWRKHFSPQIIFHNAPLVVGAVVASLLFSIVIVSLKHPDKLDDLVGYVAPPSSSSGAHVEDAAVVPPPIPTPTYVDTMPPPGHLISYENYTQFPLTGSQYGHECDKMMGGLMHHAGYWKAPAHGVMDVMHHDDVTDYHLPEGERTRVCTKTITYQLDGHVGLVADLALIAQAAALAREVRALKLSNPRARNRFRSATYCSPQLFWSRLQWSFRVSDSFVAQQDVSH